MSPRPAFWLWKLGDLLSTSVEGAVLEPTSVKLKLHGNKSHNSSLLPGVAVGITHTQQCALSMSFHSVTASQAGVLQTPYKRNSLDVSITISCVQFIIAILTQETVSYIIKR